MSDPSEHVGGEGAQDAVESLGAEAVKLVEALRDWAKDRGSDHTGATSSTTPGAAETPHDLDGHIATGGPDCTYCPVCQVISAVRGTSPEVREHLRTAAGSLVAAAAALLAPPGPDRGDPARASTVERIDIVDDAWEED